MTDTLDARVTDFITDVLGAMGLSLDVSLEETPDAVRVNLTGEGADTLLRRQGETLDALQVIVNTAFRREERGERHYLVDALGFRKSKDDELRETAKTLMETARSSGVPQEMGPLNPYARRLVHLTVAEEPGMTTESVGDAFLKTVIISSQS
jgi:spoIIIJ-associated protein